MDELEGTVLSEINQLQEDKHHGIPLTGGPWSLQGQNIAEWQPEFGEEGRGRPLTERGGSFVYKRPGEGCG